MPKRLDRSYKKNSYSNSKSRDQQAFELRNSTGSYYSGQDQQHPKFEFKSAFQRHTVRAIKEHDVTALIGPAGSSKTLLSVYAAIQLLNNPESCIRKIVVVRSAEESMNESIGSLPGELTAKLYYALAPILDNLELICSTAQITKMVEAKTIEVIPVSHLRGRSLNNTFVIVEEAQNLMDRALLTILTRLGIGSRMVFTADPLQADFRGRNGTVFLERVLEDINGCCVIKMPPSEIYRHPLLPALLKRADQLNVNI